MRANIISNYSMCPRANTNYDPRVGGDESNRMALARMPAPKDRYASILTSLYVPDIFLDVIMTPSGVFRHMKSSVDGQPCEGMFKFPSVTPTEMNMNNC